MINTGDGTRSMGFSGNNHHFINPQTRWLKHWEVFMLVFALFSTWITPIEFAFCDVLPKNLLPLLDLAEVIFFLDVLLQFYISYNYDPTHTILRYISFCWPNVIACIPWVYIYDVLGRNRVLMWFVLLRMYRLGKVFELFSRMEKSRVGFVSSKAVKNVAINLLLFHVGGCALFYSAIITPPGKEGNTWIGSLTLGEHSYTNFRDMGFWKLYVTSFYFATMIVTTVGFGDMHPVNEIEMIISITLISSTIFSFLYTSDNTTNTKEIRDEKRDPNSAVQSRENRKRFRSFFEKVSFFKDFSPQFINEICFSNLLDKYVNDSKEVLKKLDEITKAAYFEDTSELEEPLIHEKTDMIINLLDEHMNYVMEFLKNLEEITRKNMDHFDDTSNLEHMTIEKADINKQGSLGKMPLHVAASEGDVDMTRMLIESRAEVNVIDNLGNTLILEAIKGKHAEMVSFLLKKGVKLMIGDAGPFLCSVVASGDVENVHVDSVAMMELLVNSLDKDRRVTTFDIGDNASRDDFLVPGPSGSKEKGPT